MKRVRSVKDPSKAAAGKPLHDTAARWLNRFVDACLRPVLDL